MKPILILLFTMISLFATAQIEDTAAKKHFNDGMISYKSGLIEAANSLFNLSYNTEPSLEAFYFKTISDHDYKQKCEQCEKLKVQTTDEAIKQYFKECFITDSVPHPEFSTRESAFYCKLSMYIGDSAEEVRLAYCKQDFKDKSVSVIYIEPDSTNIETINPMAHFPDLNKIPSNEFIYLNADKMPEYPGGDRERLAFIYSYLKYPNEAKEQGISGMVILSFIIDEVGYVKDLRVFKSAHEILDSEALRVLRLMPQWIPGKKNGQPVKIQTIMLIKFTLN